MFILKLLYFTCKIEKEKLNLLKITYENNCNF